MERLYNLCIRNAADLTFSYDFAHTIHDYSALVDASLKNILLKDPVTNGLLDDGVYSVNSGKIASNKRMVSDLLKINKIIYELDRSTENAKNSSVLKEKLERLNNINDVITNFVLSLIHAMYWIDIPKKKSTLGLGAIKDFAMGLGEDIIKKLLPVLEKDFDIANILQQIYCNAYKKYT